MDQNHLHVIIQYTLLHYSACVLDTSWEWLYKGLAICFRALYLNTDLQIYLMLGQEFPCYFMTKQSSILKQNKAKEY